MQIKTPAIVLRTVRYGDSKLIVDLLTRQTGRVSFAVPLAKSRKGMMKRPLFQPLNLLDITFDHRPNLPLQRLGETRIASPLVALGCDPVKMSLRMFLAEFLTYTTRGEQENPTLYDYVAYSVEWLEAASGGLGNFHIVFMIRLSRFLGFYPNADSYVPGAYFDLRDGVFSFSNPLHSDTLSPVDAERMVTLLRLSFPTMHLFRMTRDERNRCLQWVLHYYRLHVPDFPDLKSLPVLAELFG